MYRQFARILQSVAVAILAIPAGPAAESGSTTLTVRVGQAERLSPMIVHLNFLISPNRAEARTTQSERIVATARTLPGRQVRVLAQIRTPPGRQMPAGLRWNGTMEGAFAGARNAVCSGGVLNSGQPSPLITGWRESGGASCSITFSLTDSQKLEPGNYPITVELALTVD